VTISVDMFRRSVFLPHLFRTARAWLSGCAPPVFRPFLALVCSFYLPCPSYLGKGLVIFKDIAFFPGQGSCPLFALSVLPRQTLPGRERRDLLFLPPSFSPSFRPSSGGGPLNVAV